MAEPVTARDRLERILLLLPLASRPGGIALAEAAEALGTDIDAVRRDLTAVAERAFYHPAGSSDGIQIYIEGDRVRVWSGGAFERPPRLTPREALALALGLRVLAAGRETEDRARLARLAARLEAGLASGEAPESPERFALSGAADATPQIRAVLEEAAARRRRCRIRYLRPVDADLMDRDVDPFALVLGSGSWYVIGHCALRDAIRVFRLDRILDASLTDRGFEVPADFDPGDWVEDGHVFRSDVDAPAVVRYSPRVAPWVRERGPYEELEDGRVAVSYPAADPAWIVRHVLLYAGEAEAVAPPAVRRAVR
ncbi:MAG: WYL domain-containing protein, partial [Gemmatimonadota bacterium]|nr:WYL domain-containing protein [Gemmatimonadota bacterium]